MKRLLLYQGPCSDFEYSHEHPTILKPTEILRNICARITVTRVFY
jgi:hypothetical protein